MLNDLYIYISIVISMCNTACICEVLARIEEFSQIDQLSVSTLQLFCNPIENSFKKMSKLHYCFFK